MEANDMLLLTQVIALLYGADRSRRPPGVREWMLIRWFQRSKITPVNLRIGGLLGGGRRFLFGDDSQLGLGLMPIRASPLPTNHSTLQSDPQTFGQRQLILDDCIVTFEKKSWRSGVRGMA